MTATLVPRDDFPLLQKFTYLNAAASGIVPLPVLREAASFDEELMQGGLLTFDAEAQDALFEAVRVRGARLINAGAADIAVATSASEALCQVAWWLHPSRGTNIVLAENDFPSVTYPWIQVARRSGAALRFVQAAPGCVTPAIEDLAGAVDERTRVIAVSHVQYGDGRALDLAALAALAHDAGALLVIDGSQSLGVLPIDLAGAQVDVFVATSCKWLCSTFGTALCFIAPHIAAELAPPFASWHSTSHPGSYDSRRIEFARGARRIEFATMSYSAVVALRAALDYLEAVGPDVIHGHVRALSLSLRAGLREMGFDIVTSEDQPLGAMTVARHPGRASDDLVQQLALDGVSVGVRFDGIRFSPHFYNTADDVDRALDALCRALD